MGAVQRIRILLQAVPANLAAPAMDNLAPRQQLAVLERSVKRDGL